MDFSAVLLEPGQERLLDTYNDNRDARLSKAGDHVDIS